MRTFANFNLWWLRKDLIIANSAPVLNRANISWISKRISEWEKFLWDMEHPLFLG